MSDILFQYHKVNPTTWVYLSSLLTIALFFKFSRLLSVRNLDLIGLILLAPGLLVVDYGLTQESPGIEQVGYIWLFVTSGLFLVRLLVRFADGSPAAVGAELVGGRHDLSGDFAPGFPDGQRR